MVDTELAAGRCQSEDLAHGVISENEPGLQSPEPLGQPSLVRFSRTAGTMLFWLGVSFVIALAINLAVYFTR
jgi:hypothetical protein